MSLPIPEKSKAAIESFVNEHPAAKEAKPTLLSSIGSWVHAKYIKLFSKDDEAVASTLFNKIKSENSAYLNGNTLRWFSSNQLKLLKEKLENSVNIPNQQKITSLFQNALGIAMHNTHSLKKQNILLALCETVTPPPHEEADKNSVYEACFNNRDKALAAVMAKGDGAVAFFRLDGDDEELIRYVKNTSGKLGTGWAQAEMQDVQHALQVMQGPKFVAAPKPEDTSVQQKPIEENRSHPKLEDINKYFISPSNLDEISRRLETHPFVFRVSTSTPDAVVIHFDKKNLTRVLGIIPKSAFFNAWLEHGEDPVKFLQKCEQLINRPRQAINSLLQNPPLHEKVSNSNLSALAPWFSTKDIATLLEQNSASSLKLVEKVIIEKSKDYWVDTSTPREEVAKRLQNNPFIFRQKEGKPTHFEIHTLHAQMNISKPLFFQLWVQSGGNGAQILDRINQLAQKPQAGPTYTPTPGLQPEQRLREAFQNKAIHELLVNRPGTPQDKRSEIAKSILDAIFDLPADAPSTAFQKASKRLQLAFHPDKAEHAFLREIDIKTLEKLNEAQKEEYEQRGKEAKELGQFLRNLLDCVK